MRVEFDCFLDGLMRRVWLSGGASKVGTYLCVGEINPPLHRKPGSQIEIKCRSANGIFLIGLGGKDIESVGNFTLNDGVITYPQDDATSSHFANFPSVCFGDDFINHLIEIGALPAGAYQRVVIEADASQSYPEPVKIYAQAIGSEALLRVAFDKPAIVVSSEAKRDTGWRERIARIKTGASCVDDLNDAQKEKLLQDLRDNPE